MAFHRATFAEINLDAFRHNIQTLQKSLQPGVEILAVVKADAYGHGAVPCAHAALEAGAGYLGVGIIEEGIELRNSGIVAPILVLGSFFIEEAKDLIQHNLVPTLCTEHQARNLSEQARKSGTTPKIHIKIDTGMTRLGVQPDQFLSLLQDVVQCKNLELEAVSTHFSSADEEDPEFTLHQLSLFSNALKQMKKAGIQVPLIHAANSAAILKYPESHFNMVRPGLILYGALPSPNLKPCVEALAKKNKEKGFIPAMQWKTKILQLNQIPKGTPLSYGRLHTATRDSQVATLPLGYADGLSRLLTNKMQMIVNGKKVPQVGAICMDLCVMDVTDVAGVEVGDEVVIFGNQGDESISVEEMAGLTGTVPYEILCSVGKRVPRVYLRKK